MKIANKITFSFLILVVFLAVSASSISYKIVRSHLENAIEAQLKTALRSRADHIETYLRMLKISVGQLSESIVLKNLLKAGSAEPQRSQAFEVAMERLIRTKQVSSVVYDFILLDTAGRIIASTDASSINQDRSTDAYFIGGQKGMYLKDAYYSETAKKPLIAVSAPVVDSQTREFIGVLAARVELNDLYRIVAEKTGMGKTGEIYIVNKYGYMITPSRFLKNTFLRQKVDTSNFRNSQLHKKRALLHKEREVISSMDYRGIMALGTHEYLPEMQWSILGEIDVREAFAPLDAIFFLFLAVMFFVPAAAWVIGMFIARMITGPIHRLHKGTETIGSGNLDYKVGTNANDEIGQLSRSFDQMTADLKRSRDQLKDWAGTLEGRVKERTGELNQAQEATLNILEDLTEAKNKIEEAMKIKSDFISMVSHELRTPLTAIKEGIGIVLDGSAGETNGEQKEFLDIAKRNVDRLSRLINDVLDYQKLEAGRMDFYMRVTDCGVLIEDVTKVMQPVAKNKSIFLDSRTAVDVPTIILDSDKIMQVLINLVSNAIKFTDTGGVTVSASVVGSSVVFSVKDTGVGIKKEDLPKLFHGFSQLEEGRARKKGSTGLGLAISKKIVLEHGGKIWIESEHGKGSDFKFSLPVKTKYNVLIIDDDEKIIDTCKRFLEFKEYAVASSEKGLDALRLIEANKPDIVILDMRLKDTSGYEIIGRLRSNKDTVRIPILAISGYSEELGKVEDMKEDLALSSISKPFNLEDLLSSVRLLLKQRAS